MFNAWLDRLTTSESRRALTMSKSQHRPRANSTRLPLYGELPPRYNPRSESPDSTAYRHRAGRGKATRRRWNHIQNYLWSCILFCRIHRPRTWLSCFRWALLVLVSVGLIMNMLWELHIEIMVYPRSWIAREITPVKPLEGCFARSRISKSYNMSAAMGPKHLEIQAGIPMRLGLDCYDFASTIQSHPRPPAGQAHDPIVLPDWELEYAGGDTVYFHTYWRSGLAPFGERQEWLLKSFFATQNLTRSRLILWSNAGTLRTNAHIAPWLKRFPNNFELRVINTNVLAQGTALEGSDLLNASDDRAWVDSDLTRLLVTYAVGGVWIDMDSLLIRDMAPLLEHEFVTQWDCYDKIYQPFNGAVMHFFKHSPYLCEMFWIMARGQPPRSGTTDWGSLLYHKVFRSLNAAGVQPFKVLPFCLTDARSCRLDNRLPDPFKPDPPKWAGAPLDGGKLDTALHNLFSVHLHNQWDKTFPKGGWVERMLLRRYELNLPDTTQ